MKIAALWSLLGVLAFSLPSKAQVTASLVTAETSAQPGHSLTAAVELEHAPTWHTYWVNAGTGYPTRVRWRLPPGWAAGEINWPTPTTIVGSDGSVTGNGYTGTVLLPVTLAVPSNATPGQRVTLKAHITWLMCSDQCIPGEGDATLSLNVSAGVPASNSAVRAQLAKQSMPQPVAAEPVSAHRAGDRITLRITGAAAMQAPHFFSADGLVAYDEPQQTRAGSNFQELTLPVSSDAPPNASKLVGVLAYTASDDTYKGIQIDTSFSPSTTSGAARSERKANPAENESTQRATRADSPSTLATLAFAFLGGVILNLMPCVFPVLGIKIMTFVSQAGSDRRKLVLHGLAYSAGVILSFWILAGLLAVLRAGGHQLAWGFQLQSAAFVYSLAVVMLVFALSLSGVFDFGMSIMGVGSQAASRRGFGGSFFSGVLATLVATPCSAPMLAPAIGVALAVSAPESLLIFTAVAFGLSLPYLLLSMFPRAVALLPRPGRWMETFKQFMAFPLYGTVGCLIWVLAAQTSDNGLLMSLLGLTLVAMAIWVYGRNGAGTSPAWRARVSAAVTVLLLTSGLYIGWPARVAGSTETSWEPWSAARVAELRAAGRPIYVDFTARWCATCQVNKRVVFTSSEIQGYIRAHQVATLKADWTNSDPRITAELEKWHRASVPFDLIYLPGRPDPVVLPEVLSVGVVLDALRNGRGK